MKLVSQVATNLFVEAPLAWSGLVFYSPNLVINPLHVLLYNIVLEFKCRIRKHVTHLICLFFFM